MEPFDSAAHYVAAAQGKLEAARKSGSSSLIAIAQIELAATFAGAGDLPAAVAEFNDVIDYLELAQGDEEAENRRWLRMTSLSAPPPTAQDFDPLVLQTIARMHLAECLLESGERAGAQTQLELAKPGTKGFGKGRLRKQLALLQGRMNDAANPQRTEVSGVRDDDRSPNLAEQLAAADELLGNGQFQDSARIALRVIAACESDEIAMRARARQVLGMALEGMEQPHDAADVLRECFNDYLLADQDDAAARVAVPLAWRLNQLGDHHTHEAIDILQRALTVSTSSALTLRVQLMTDLGSLLDQVGSSAEAKRHLEGAVAVADQSGDSELQANARHGLAVVLATSQSADREAEVEALSLLDHTRDQYDLLGMMDRSAGCEHEAAALLGRLQSYPAAATRYQRALDRYQQLPADDQDTGTWPDEVADVRRNLAALASLNRPGATLETTVAAGLFESGGHQMSHSASS